MHSSSCVTRRPPVKKGDGVVSVDGKAVLLVGAARPPGIGRAAVMRLARGGARLVIADCIAVADAESSGAHGTGRVQRETLEQVGRDATAVSGQAVLTLDVDPLDPDSVAGLVERARSHLGALDAVCHLVGATGARMGDGPLLSIEPADWERGLAWNLTAAWTMARACAPVLGDGGGSLVLLSSYAAIDPTPNAGVVSVARAAVNHLSRVLARELGSQNIRTNTVCPLGVERSDGILDNPGLVKVAAAEGMSVPQWLARQIPLGRGQSSDEVAAVIEFLVSDASSFLSGVTIPVAGGTPA